MHILLHVILLNYREEGGDSRHSREGVMHIILFDLFHSVKRDLIARISGDPRVLKGPLGIVSLKIRDLAKSANEVLRKTKHMDSTKSLLTKIHRVESSISQARHG